MDEALKAAQFRSHRFVTSFNEAVRQQSWDEEAFAVARNRHSVDAGRAVQVLMAALCDAIFRHVLASRWAWYEAEHKQLTRYASSKLRDAVLEGRSPDQFVDSAIDRTRDGFRRWRRKHRSRLQDHLRDCIASEISNRRRAIKRIGPNGMVSVDDLPESSQPFDDRASEEIRSREFLDGMRSYLRLLETTDKRLCEFVQCWLAAYQAGQGANANQFVAKRLNISIEEARNLSRRVREHARNRARNIWEG